MGDTCRSCSARIVFAITTSGRRIPVDPPTAGGNLRVWTQHGVRYAAHQAPEGVDYVMCKSHFATCPNADKHRKPRRRRRVDADG